MSEVDLEVVRANIEKDLRSKVRRGLVTLTTECLGPAGLPFFGALGIDAHTKLLEIFIDEAKQLLAPYQEDTDA